LNDKIPDSQSSNLATLRRVDLIQKEEEKPGKDMIDLEVGDPWERLIAQNDVPVLLNFYKKHHHESKLLYPRLMDMFITSKETWKLVGADIDKVPALVKYFNIKELPTLVIVNKGAIIDFYSGVPSDLRLGNLLYKIHKCARGDKI